MNRMKELRRRNKPLWWLVAICICLGMALGMRWLFGLPWELVFAFSVGTPTGVLLLGMYRD